MSAVTLDVAGTIATITVPDDQWRRTLEQLWEPFIAAGGVADVRFEVTPRESNWIIGSDDGEKWTETDPWLALDRLRYELVERALDRDTDSLHLHGAAAVKDGTCVVFAGPSGSGKSTLALRFAEAWWELLTEDVVRISSDGTVLPFPRPLGIKDRDEWRRLAERWDPPDWELHARGNLPAPAKVFPLADERARPTAFVFPEFRRGAETTLTPISRAAAVTELGTLVRRADPDAIARLSEVLEEGHTARIVFGSSYEVVPMLGRWLLELKVA